MIREIISNIKNIEKNILRIMFLGFKFCFIISILSSLVLVFYILNPITYLLYECGTILFKTSLRFAVTFFICAVILLIFLKIKL